MSFGNRLYAELRGDRVIWAILIILSIFSVLAVYSSATRLALFSKDVEVTRFLTRQIFFVGMGFVVAYLFYLLHYMRFSRWAPYLLAACIPLLFYTIWGGLEVNSAKRWVEIPILKLSFQTSDFAKVALIVYVARIISSKQSYIKDLQSAFLPIIVPILIICGLIAPMDLSTGILLFATCVALMFVGRVSLKYIALLLLLGMVVFSMLIVIDTFYPDLGFRVSTWIERLNAFMYGDGGPQVNQAKSAIANGGIFGVAPGNSIQRYYLFSGHSDFIYALICEEYGLFGAFLVLFAYVTLFFRCVRIMTRSTKSFGALLALGLGLMICLQALVNMAVSVNVVPVTGQPLPLVSMGGTSILFTCISIGMILSVSKMIEREREIAAVEAIGEEV